MQIYPVILCGGAGSRLWPVSRELHPKPFIRLQDNESFLQKAYIRSARLPGAHGVLTVTNHDLLFKTQAEYAELHLRDVSSSFILEPFGRNTAAAVCAAALHLSEKHGDDAMLLILAADHLIANQEAFAQAVTEAKALARQGKLVTFGIRPSAPETGYGYIEADGSNVVRFVEKPCLELAQEYVATGRFFWNSGMFCFEARTILGEMRKYCPKLLDTVQACLARSTYGAEGGFDIMELDAQSFGRVPDVSIDYAVMEKSSAVTVVPCDIGWSDIGSWSALSELVSADAEGNRVEGEAVLHEVSNTYIRGDERLVGAVGVDNLIVVDTPDALLIADRSRAQDVKHIYKQLKTQGREAYKLHRTVHRPWGTYAVLEEGTRYKIKRIVVKPGATLSLQMHHHRSEHWIVVSGMARVINGSNEKLIATNESTYIPAGVPHRVSNPGVLDLVMIEVQSGDYLGEDDIVRYEDKYGRC